MDMDLASSFVVIVVNTIFLAGGYFLVQVAARYGFVQVDISPVTPQVDISPVTPVDNFPTLGAKELSPPQEQAQAQTQEQPAEMAVEVEVGEEVDRSAIYEAGNKIEKKRKEIISKIREEAKARELSKKPNVTDASSDQCSTSMEMQDFVRHQENLKWARNMFTQTYSSY